MKFLNLLIFLTFFSISLIAQNGVVKSYYPSRAIKSELSYINDILDGTAKYYYENGNLKTEKTFSRGILNGWIREYFSNGKLKEEYLANFGIIDGDKKEYDEAGQLRKIFTFEEGILRSKKEFLPENKIGKADTQIVLAKVKESITQPIIVGGIEEIQNKIVYPNDALKFGLEGKVEILATIDSTGNLFRASVQKGIGLGCDEAALDAVKKSKFIAATKNDVNVEGELVITLNFIIPREITDNNRNKNIPSQIQKEGESSEHISILCEADKCPRPEDDLKTIYSRFEIPNVAKALKVKGAIIIEGIVDKEGNFSNTNVLEGVGYGCDQLVENSLLKSKFSPAVKQSQTVEAKIVLNFPFNYER